MLCDVPPVVVKVFGIEPYGVPGTVEYLHAALSLLVRVNVADVVPGGRVPVGCPLKRPGGVKSGTGLLIVTETELDVLVFAAASLATAVRVWPPFEDVLVFQDIE